MENMNNYVEILVNTVAKTLVEAFENLTIEDINMYQLGYNKAIEDYKKILIENNVIPEWKEIIEELAEKLKLEVLNGNKDEKA